MVEDKCLEARNMAGNYFRQGYNCAESMFLTFRPHLAPEIDETLVRMATPFGGGTGRSGCMCGALAAAVMMLGLSSGRTSACSMLESAYELTKEFHARFIGQFGATCCRALNKHPFDTPEQGRNCLKIIGTTAKLLMAFLLEKRLIELPAEPAQKRS